MIPKTIHYCWFGDDAPGDDLQRCIESWRRLMPDYQLREWNISNSPIDNRYCQTVLHRRLWSKLSNYIRLHALNVEGGVYLDTDVEVVRRLDPLLDDACFLGFQLPWHATDWVNNAVLAARPGHSFLAECLRLTTERFEETGEILRSPTVTTSALRRRGLRQYGWQLLGDIRLYSTECFYPYAWNEPESRERVTTNTYCVHHWAGSWVKHQPRVFARPMRMVKDFRRALGITTSRRAA